MSPVSLPLIDLVGDGSNRDIRMVMDNAQALGPEILTQLPAPPITITGQKGMTSTRANGENGQSRVDAEDLPADLAACSETASREASEQPVRSYRLVRRSCTHTNTASEVH